MPAKAAFAAVVSAILTACAGAAPVAGVAPGGQQEPRLTLVKAAVPGTARSFVFVAEIQGGADNNPDLYCQGSTWDFGDGPPLSVTPGCTPWTADVKIPRRFENTHAYEKPGAYTAAFTYGPLTARLSLDVP